MSSIGSTHRILVVDDNDGDLKLLEEAVIASGFPILITRARNAFEALDVLAGDNGFNLILTDLNMPRMSGLELCDHLKNLPEVSSIPRIVMSGGSVGRLPIKMNAPKSTPFVVKPHTWAGFLEFVGQIWQRLRDQSKSASSTRQQVQPSNPPPP